MRRFKFHLSLSFHVEHIRVSHIMIQHSIPTKHSFVRLGIYKTFNRGCETRFAQIELLCSSKKYAHYFTNRNRKRNTIERHAFNLEFRENFLYRK